MIISQAGAKPDFNGKLKIIGGVTFIILVMMILYQFSRVNYLLFHSSAEIYSIVIAFAVFLISWNVRNQIENRLLVYLGIAYLFIGILDLLHTLSYVGMNIFTDYDYYANQLWIGARYMESISLALFFLASGRQLRISYPVIISVYSVITILLSLSIFYWKVFPICFIPGVGLTPFKIYSEYIICAFLVISLVSQHQQRKLYDVKVRRYLRWAIILTILGELAFTFYISNYGFSNLIGHYLKIGSFYLIYKALIETGLRHPLDLLYREIKTNEYRLEKSEEQLKHSLDSLKKEVAERKKAEETVRANLKEKELLLQEIHHRVKNNMGLVSGFLSLQMATTESKETVDALTECQNRVHTISLIHETIYKSDDLATIDLNIYLRGLIDAISKGMNIHGNIQINVDIDSIIINARQASPIGIVINELVTNAIKYAFPDHEQGVIDISVKKSGDRGVKLIVADNGIGIPDSHSKPQPGSLGQKLVKQITEKQLGGSLKIEIKKGTKFHIDFNIQDI